MTRLMGVLLLGSVIGCGSPPPSTGDPSRKITWAEFQAMDAEQRNDPYVQDNLDDEARAKWKQAQSRRSR